MNTHYNFHPLANILPLMEGDEFDLFAASIKERGLLDPIVILDGLILDGRNRYRACMQIGVEPRFEQFTGNAEDAAKFVMDRNLHRRHLTTAQKMKAIQRLVLTRPEQSNRSIAKQIMASHHTINNVRKDLESTGQIAQLKERVASNGKRHPATRRSKAERKPRKVSTTTLKKNMKVFERSIAWIADRCEFMEEIAIPQLTSDQRESAYEKLQAARSSLLKLMQTIKPKAKGDSQHVDARAV